MKKYVIINVNKNPVNYVITPHIQSVNDADARLFESAADAKEFLKAYDYGKGYVIRHQHEAPNKRSKIK